MALLVGVLLKLCTKKLKIPYTPVLTVVGLIFGLLDHFVFNESIEEHAVEEVVKELHIPQQEQVDIHAPLESVVRQTLHGFYDPSPELVFLIFLPALIFESAFNSDWYTFKRQFLKILIMAGPMLIFSTFVTAAGMYYILGFESEN